MSNYSQDEFKTAIRLFFEFSKQLPHRSVKDSLNFLWYHMAYGENVLPEASGRILRSFVYNPDGTVKKSLDDTLGRAITKEINYLEQFLNDVYSDNITPENISAKRRPMKLGAKSALVMSEAEFLAALTFVALNPDESALLDLNADTPANLSYNPLRDMKTPLDVFKSVTYLYENPPIAEDVNRIINGLPQLRSKIDKELAAKANSFTSLFKIEETEQAASTNQEATSTPSVASSSTTFTTIVKPRVKFAQLVKNSDIITHAFEAILKAHIDELEHRNHGKNGSSYPHVSAILDGTNHKPTHTLTRWDDHIGAKERLFNFISGIEDSKSIRSVSELITVADFLSEELRDKDIAHNGKRTQFIKLGYLAISINCLKDKGIEPTNKDIFDAAKALGLNTKELKLFAPKEHDTNTELTAVNRLKLRTGHAEFLIPVIKGDSFVTDKIASCLESIAGTHSAAVKQDALRSIKITGMMVKTDSVIASR